MWGGQPPTFFYILTSNSAQKLNAQVETGTFMGEGKLMREPTTYKITIKGHLDERWNDWFNGLTVTHESKGTTTLSGSIVDQSALHSVLAKIQALNLALISVNKIDPE